ncbi:unnamed protein product [Pleuronectes platessa]|uniref:Uncharacterized protein n=1 Tax=Pleuronectes platessa TaxID=8262 RepID=A0A9N7YAJ9_PLEPL|nr:unnamed protein product [Pleuronectes platessa]
MAASRAWWLCRRYKDFQYELHLPPSSAQTDAQILQAAKSHWERWLRSSFSFSGADMCLFGERRPFSDGCVTEPGLCVCAPVRVMNATIGPTPPSSPTPNRPPVHDHSHQ